MENQYRDKKSLQLFTKNNPDWKSLAKDCVGFANSKGGYIHIGIEDKDDLPPMHQQIPPELPEKIRKRVAELTVNVGLAVSVRSAVNQIEFIEIEIYPSLTSIASTGDGQYYIRISDTCKPVLPDDLGRLFTDKPAFQWETKVVQKIHWSEADSDKLRQFLFDIHNSQRISDFVKQKSDEEVLAYYHFINEEGWLTNLGVLWIGKRQQRAKLLYAPVIQFLKFDENQQKIRKSEWSDFSLNPKELLETIWLNIPEWKEGIEVSEGMLGRRILYHYNENVVRELLVNALVHRPYTTRGDIFINLYQDRLEIHNPGLLPLGVTPHNILHKSIKRNEHLSKVFMDLGLMEREGSGYDKIFEIQASEAKEIPFVEEESDRVIVTVYNQISSIEVIHFIETVKQQFHLTQKEIICLGIIAQRQSILATEFAQRIQSATDKQIRSWRGRLIEYGIVKTKGKTKGMEYFVDPKALKGSTLATTQLKRIEPHRLKELILTDLHDYGKTTLEQLHKRIGNEIPERKVRRVLKELVEDKKVTIQGSRKFRTYESAQ